LNINNLAVIFGRLGEETSAGTGMGAGTAIYRLTAAGLL